MIAVQSAIYTKINEDGIIWAATLSDGPITVSIFLFKLHNEIRRNELYYY